MKTLRTVAARCRQKPSCFESVPFPAPGAPASPGRTHYPDSLAFTAEEHLGVQQQIEQRARELWRHRGRQTDNALNDWLQAEEEVVIRFIRIRINLGGCQPLILSSLPFRSFNRQRRPTRNQNKNQSSLDRNQT